MQVQEVEASLRNGVGRIAKLVVCSSTAASGPAQDKSARKWLFQPELVSEGWIKTYHTESKLDVLKQKRI